MEEEQNIRSFCKKHCHEFDATTQRQSRHSKHRAGQQHQRRWALFVGDEESTAAVGGEDGVVFGENEQPDGFEQEEEIATGLSLDDQNV